MSRLHCSSKGQTVTRSQHTLSMGKRWEGLVQSQILPGHRALQPWQRAPLEPCEGHLWPISAVIQGSPDQ